MLGHGTATLAALKVHLHHQGPHRGSPDDAARHLHQPPRDMTAHGSERQAGLHVDELGHERLLGHVDAQASHGHQNGQTHASDGLRRLLIGTASQKLEKSKEYVARLLFRHSPLRTVAAPGDARKAPRTAINVRRPSPSAASASPSKYVGHTARSSRSSSGFSCSVMAAESQSSPLRRAQPNAKHGGLRKLRFSRFPGIPSLRPSGSASCACVPLQEPSLGYFRERAGEKGERKTAKNRESGERCGGSFERKWRENRWLGKV
eukprot:scaffold149_cov315-Pinguiococcus_pyrenoidosus.AAC.101